MFKTLMMISLLHNFLDLINYQKLIPKILAKKKF